MNGAAPTMMAIVTTGTGGTDKLQIRQVPVPVPGPEDVLLKVLAAGVNNTEINTRLGWYSSSVRGGTADAGEAGERADGGWNEATPFPLIQGTDCCGEIVAVLAEEMIANSISPDFTSCSSWGSWPSCAPGY